MAESAVTLMVPAKDGREPKKRRGSVQGFGKEGKAPRGQKFLYP